MGFSSALIGSAMAFDFRMFHEIAPTLKGSDISKAMETALLTANIYTEYLEEVVCYSKKKKAPMATKPSVWGGCAPNTAVPCLLSSSSPLPCCEASGTIATNYFNGCCLPVFC